MAFEKKVWKDRIAEYINRRLLTFEDSSTKLVTVARDEGTISQEGDPFSAAMMNDIEDWIQNEFDSQNLSLNDCLKSVSDGKKTVASAITAQGVNTAADAEFATMAANITAACEDVYAKGYSNGGKGKNVIKYLGTGTSFNISSIPGLNKNNITKDNFIVGITSMPSINTGKNSNVNEHWAQASGFNLSKNYNPNTGILTVGGNGQTISAWRDEGDAGIKNSGSKSQTGTCFAYVLY